MHPFCAYSSSRAKSRSRLCCLCLNGSIYILLGNYHTTTAYYAEIFLLYSVLLPVALVLSGLVSFLHMQETRKLSQIPSILPALDSLRVRAGNFQPCSARPTSSVLSCSLSTQRNKILSLARLALPSVQVVEHKSKATRSHMSHISL